MELTDIMSADEWKQLANEIYDKFGFNGTVYKIDNAILAKSDEWSNQLCPTIKSGGAIIICASAQSSLSKIVQEKKESATSECDAGLMKFLIPIFVESKFLGMVGGCGCVNEHSDVDAYYVGKMLEREDVSDLAGTVRRITRDRMFEAVEYVQNRINQALKSKFGQ
jgi:ligand-binding sensor protein